MTKKDRREIGEGIVSYEARKGPGDVARENAWCLFLILASAAALFSASESFRDWKVWVRWERLRWPITLPLPPPFLSPDGRGRRLVSTDTIFFFFQIPSAFAALLALLNATAVCERLVLFRGLGVQVRYSVQGVFWGEGILSRFPAS